MAGTDLPPASRTGNHGLGFWVVALAFATAMAFTTVPTPLWSLYAQRDRLSSLTVTIVFAAYALAVALSLFLAGHLSDWYGRRRVLMPAIAFEILAGVVFVVWPSLAGLLLARVLSGLGVGAITATATAWLAELRGGTSGRAQIVSTGANLGGLGFGGLLSGVLAQWAGHALLVPFLVFTAALLVAWVALLAAPETHGPRSPRPRYRPQRISVPARSRGRFIAAALGAAITFAVFGLLTSLAPSFLAGTFHQPSHALAGAVSFAVFATAAVTQTLTASRPTRQLLAGAIPALLAGLGLLTVAVWLPSPSFGVFLTGGVVVGIGTGLMFKGAIGTVSEISSPDHRAEALAGLFLAAYLGLAGPVIGLGALTQIASTRVSLLVFGGLLALGIVVATPALLGLDSPSRHRRRAQPDRSRRVSDSVQDHADRPRRPADHLLRVRRGPSGRSEAREDWPGRHSRSEAARPSRGLPAPIHRSRSEPDRLRATKRPDREGHEDEQQTGKPGKRPQRGA